MQPIEDQNENREGTHADNIGTNPFDNDSMMMGKWEFDGINVACASVTSIAETEGLKPETIEEAQKWLDWIEWENVVSAELKSLDEAHTWNVVERPVKTNIVN